MRKEYSVEFLNEIKVRFPDVSIKIHSARRVYVKIPRDKVHDLAKFLFEEKSLRLSTATGIDTRDGIEIIYNFSHDASGTYYNIKTLLPKSDLRIKSLSGFLPAANWIEREIHDLLGIDFIGHQNLIPFLTPEDWPKSTFPLRRDYAKLKEKK